MITLERAAWQDEERFPRFVGLAADGFPSATDPAVVNGTEYYIMDTGKTYKYDKENDNWDVMPTGTGGASSWGDIEDKPFEEIGDGLMVDGNKLTYDPEVISNVDYVDDNITDTMNFIIQERNTERAARIAGDELLQTQITNLKNIGRFCAIWDADAGAPTTEPPTMPYEYKVGDYFRIGSAGYKVPTGSQYNPGEYDLVEEETGIGDVWYYDGTQWVKQVSGGGEIPDKPYLSLNRLSRYLYNVTFLEVPDYIDINTDYGACSSYVKDGKLYRNLDWKYDNGATFKINLPNIEGTAFIDGLTDTDLDDTLIGQLPYHMVDGVNENGIMVATHVLFNDFEYANDGDTPLGTLPYLVLSRVKSMATIEADLADILDDLKPSVGMITAEYLIQLLVTDGTTTYIIRPTDDSTYEAVNATANPKLTNFRWVADTDVVRTNLQTRPTGVERWNAMPTDLKNLRYTKCYEAPNRLSEFIGIDETTKDSTDEELETIYDEARAIYLNRERDGETWQTMHSAVYGQNGLEHLWIQENWDKDYITTGVEYDNVTIGVNATGQLEVKTAYRLPASTTSDNDKFLRVVNGAAAWVAVPNAENNSF